MQTISRLFWRRIFIWILCPLFLARPAGADDQLEILQIGRMRFTNVTVTTKSSSDIFFSHASGFGNAKVRDIDRQTLRKLGYKVPDEEPASVFDTPAITNFVADPRVQQAEAMLAAEAGELLDRFDDRVIHGIVGGVILLHLLYSLLCRLICVKAGTNPGLLIWIPFFQQASLLRAAGLSGWWLFPSIIPPIGFVIYVWWSFRIARVRQKSGFVTFLLLLPITNILAFVYLALSGVGGKDAKSSSVISLVYSPTNREAA